jgi:hypothetical protein
MLKAKVVIEESTTDNVCNPAPRLIFASLKLFIFKFLRSALIMEGNELL